MIKTADLTLTVLEIDTTLLPHHPCINFEAAQETRITHSAQAMTIELDLLPGTLTTMIDHTVLPTTILHLQAQWQ